MELLLPAGSFSALKAAVQSGADAVYIGGSRFSARRGAANFTLSEIEEAVNYCHLRNVKLHVAANILIKEKEISEFLEYIGELNRIGVDAVIIQDIGMASVIRKIYPDLPLHASTQMTVTSVAMAKRLKDIGFERVVLARELSGKAIEKICKGVDIEVEVFAHGALCMSYSGQCLMSSIIGGRSGNRGACAQPCRLSYTVSEKNGYLLSPKDLCMIEHLGELKKIGVKSLKIEGRLKRSEYVAAVCGVYRKELDNTGGITEEDRQELYNAFSRSGFTDGYFCEKTGRDMMCYENPANASENIFTDEVRARCREDANLIKSRIFISAELLKGKPFSVSIWDEDGIFVLAEGSLPETAINRPMDKDRLVKQLLKLGDTPFWSDGAEVMMDDGITLPVSEINEVRRRAVLEYSKRKCDGKLRRSFRYEKSKGNETVGTAPVLVAEVMTYEQAKTAIDCGINEIYAETPLANRLFSEYPNLNIIAKLPSIPRDDREYEKPETNAVLIQNLGQLDEKKRCYGDFRLNVYNGESVSFYKNLERLTISPELNLKEMEDISEGCEIIGYGRIPLMVMENCPLKALGKCQDRKFKANIRDRKKEEFPLKCGEGCTLELLNSKPIFMADKLENMNNLKISAIRLIFTVENSRECGKIIKEYKMGLLGKNVSAMPENTFTRGHFYRGVE